MVEETFITLYVEGFPGDKGTFSNILNTCAQLMAMMERNNIEKDG